MKMKFMLIGLLAVAGLATAQKVKSQKEGEAVNAVIAAQTPDARIAAVENLLSKFKDTEFKAAVLEMAANAAQQKNDAAATMIYGNRALEANPKSMQALLIVSSTMAQGTKEFDLDKDEKVKKATKMAGDAIAIINTAEKPNPQLPDEQWISIKKDMISRGHETLGMLAAVDKKYDVAIAEFKTAVEAGATPEPAVMIRLAVAYTNTKRFDEANATVDRVLAMAGTPEALKKIAQEEKARIAKLKGGQ
ncbi:MAG: tetratricopeptide repeat protein [Bryobacterales bacterium]|nr:tetratricopeptide repeat protein [Bryobacterales bacterium]